MPIPQMPEVGPRSIEDVLDYARVIEGAANLRGVKHSLSTLAEMSANLDIYSGRLCTNKTVAVSGLHKVVRPDTEEESGVVSYLQHGIAQGEAQGFSVCEVDELEPTLNEDGQEEAFDELRSRVDSYAVSQLLTHNRRSVVTPDQGVIVNQLFQVVAPIRTNDIVLPEVAHLHTDYTAVYRHARDILSTAGYKGTDQIREVSNKLVLGPHTLESLVEIAPTINTFLAHHEDVYKDALSDMIASIFPETIVNQIYEAVSVPPSYVPSKEVPGAFDICHVDLPSTQIAFTDIAFYQRYFIDKVGNVIASDSSPPGVFLGAITSISPWGNTLQFHVPLEHVHVAGNRVYNRHQIIK